MGEFDDLSGDSSVRGVDATPLIISAFLKGVSEMVPEPAPSEHAQLTARQKITENLNSLLEDLEKRFKRRMAQLSNFGTHTGSGIAHTLSREASIHMGTLYTVTSGLTLEFIQFLEKEPISRSAVHYSVSIREYDGVVKVLYDCVELMGIDESTKFAKLALTIVTKGTKVSGLFFPLNAPVAVAEIAETLKDIIETGGIKTDEERKTAQFLLELEFMMMFSLSAAEYAAAVVHIWTRTDPPQLHGIDGNADARAARAYVVQHLKKVRHSLSESEPQTLFEFPEGLWLDTWLRRKQAEDKTDI
jgi:hypothetical protein